MPLTRPLGDRVYGGLQEPECARKGLTTPNKPPFQLQRPTWTNQHICLQSNHHDLPTDLPPKHLYDLHPGLRFFARFGKST